MSKQQQQEDSPTNGLSLAEAAMNFCMGYRTKGSAVEKYLNVITTPASDAEPAEMRATLSGTIPTRKRK
jgi:hypothetical protein